MKDILSVVKKELKAILRDKAILAQIIVLPFAVVFGYAMLMSMMNETEEPSEVTAYYADAPEMMVEGLQALGLKEMGEETPETIKEAIGNKNCDLFIVFPKDFAVAEAGTSSLSDIEMWYNSSDTGSAILRSNVLGFFDAFRPTVFTVNAKTEVDYDLGEETYMARKLLGTVLPMLLLMMVFTVCMNLAAETVAGDKERGFLNTMLIAPVKRSSIAAGKAICIFMAAVAGGISAFAGMAVSLPKMASALGMENGLTYSMKEYVLLFAVTITAVFALAGLLLVISSVAKDAKQATSIAPVIMVAMMIASFLTMVDGFGRAVENLGMANAVIPAWNAMTVMQNIMLLEYSPVFVAVTCVANLAFTAICITVVGKMFENEKIVNG